MAICGFRADNYDFGILEGAGLPQLVSFLERARGGLSPEEVGEDNCSLVEALQRAGLVLLRDKSIVLAPEGEKLLKTFRNAINSPS